MHSDAYHLAQSAMADLKSAVYLVLESAPSAGLTNAEVGRTLGIYGGHEGHEGHISRTLLQQLKSERVVVQGENKKWLLEQHLDID